MLRHPRGPTLIGYIDCSTSSPGEPLRRISLPASEPLSADKAGAWIEGSRMVRRATLRQSDSEPLTTSWTCGRILGATVCDERNRPVRGSIAPWTALSADRLVPVPTMVTGRVPFPSGHSASPARTEILLGDSGLRRATRLLPLMACPDIDRSASAKIPR